LDNTTVYKRVAENYAELSENIVDVEAA